MRLLKDLGLIDMETLHLPSIKGERGSYVIFGLDEKEDVTGVDFMSAEFAGSFFGIDFSGSDLSGCYFGNSNFNGCSFKNARLSGANMDTAGWGYCDFEGADLSGTCMDPETDYMQYYAEELIQEYGWVHNGKEGLRMWRTDISLFYPIHPQFRYMVGETHVAPALSDSKHECHPGIHLCELGSALDIARSSGLRYPDIRVVECFVEKGKFVWHKWFEDTIRCKEIEVIGYVD